MTELIHTFDEATGQRSARKLADIAPPAPAPTSNLADLNLGTFTSTGGADNTATFVQHRSGARIKEIIFTFRDRRAELSGRSGAVTVPASAFAGVNGGWSLRFEGVLRYGISKTFTLAGADYLALIQWAALPTGYVFWFQDFHGNQWNTYGKFENVIIKWEAQ